MFALCWCDFRFAILHEDQIKCLGQEVLDVSPLFRRYDFELRPHVLWEKCRDLDRSLPRGWPRYSEPKQNFVAPPTVRHGERSEAIQPRRDA